jgi:hypothetical protein
MTTMETKTASEKSEEIAGAERQGDKETRRRGDRRTNVPSVSSVI